MSCAFNLTCGRSSLSVDRVGRYASAMQPPR